MKTDNWVTEDGFYFDDFQVLVVNGPNTGIEGPAPGKPIVSEPVPNPATDRVTFLFGENESLTNTQFEIYDLSGKTVFSETIIPGTRTRQISVENWEPGVYFYQVKGTSVSSETKKLIIL